MLSHMSKLVLMFLGLVAAVLNLGLIFLLHPFLIYMSTSVSLVYILFSVWVMTSVPTTTSGTTTTPPPSPPV